MELLCIQSQEHPELPKAELKAVMECEGIEANINVITQGLVVLTDIPNDKCNRYYEILTKRLGYTHEVHEIISTSSTDKLNEDVSSVNWEDYIDETFAVRVKRFHSEIDTVATERKVGSLILENCDNIKVNLKKPKSLVRIVAFEDIIFIAIERIKLNKNILKKASLIKGHFSIHTNESQIGKMHG